MKTLNYIHIFPMDDPPGVCGACSNHMACNLQRNLILPMVHPPGVCGCIGEFSSESTCSPWMIHQEYVVHGAIICLASSNATSASPWLIHQEYVVVWGTFRFDGNGHIFSMGDPQGGCGFICTSHKRKSLLTFFFTSSAISCSLFRCVHNMLHVIASTFPFTFFSAAFFFLSEAFFFRKYSLLSACWRFMVLNFLH